jgi:anaerobic magnesium-protoporphyrin IX monomethyl ester cyclase
MPDGIVTLLVPPHLPPMVPQLGVAALSGILQDYGHRCTTIDFNIRFQNTILHSPRFIDEVCEYYERIVNRYNAYDNISLSDRSDFLAALKNYFRLMHVRMHRSAAARKWRKTVKDDLEALPFGYPNQQDAMKLIEQVSLLFGTENMHHGCTSSTIKSQNSSGPDSVIIQFFHDILEQAGCSDGNIFGISVISTTQFPYTCILTRFLRNQYPCATLIVGGSAASAYSEYIGEAGESEVDAVIIGEGENALRDLLLSGKQITDSGRIIHANKVVPFPPTPRFEPDELTGYWANPLVLPIQFGRGCYWGKCAFCSYHRFYNAPRRYLTPVAAVEQILKLSKKYSCNEFHIVDDCLHPDFLREFAESLIKNSMSVRWSASVRFESAFRKHDLATLLAASGCRRLTFGLESAAQRLLDYIRKGIRIADCIPILETCREAEITVHLNWISGLPTETKQEQDMTRAFLHKTRHLYAYAFGHIFTLENGSPFLTNPDVFNLSPGAIKDLRRNVHQKHSIEVVHEDGNTSDEKTVKSIHTTSTDNMLHWTSSTVYREVNFNISTLCENYIKPVERLKEPLWCIFNVVQETFVLLNQNNMNELAKQLIQNNRYILAEDPLIAYLCKEGFLE